MINHFNESSKEKKMEVLYTAEREFNNVWTASEKVVLLQYELKDCKKEIEEAKPRIIAFRIVAIAFLIAGAVLACLAIILSETLLGLLPMFLWFPCLLGSVLTFLIPYRLYKKDLDQNTKKLPELKLQLADAEKLEKEVKEQNITGMVIRSELCPECNTPQELRMFIGYFESGRADSLKEAKNLFAQERHQLQMQKLTREQIAASEAARQAAERAEEAARSAQNAAKSAQTQATWAAYEARRK